MGGVVRELNDKVLAKGLKLLDNFLYIGLVACLI